MRFTLHLTILFMGAVFMVDSSKLAAAEEVDPEQAVCGALREPLATISILVVAAYGRSPQ